MKSPFPGMDPYIETCVPGPDVPLELGPLIQAVYERSRYSRRIDYAKALHPPLTPEQSVYLEGPPRAENHAGKSPATRQRKGRR
jgi:Protein of unknown function (DUF4058)